MVVDIPQAEFPRRPARGGRLLADLLIVIFTHLAAGFVVILAAGVAMAINQSQSSIRGEESPASSVLSQSYQLAASFRDPLRATITISFFLIEFCIALLAFRLAARRPDDSIFRFFSAWRVACLNALFVAFWITLLGHHLQLPRTTDVLVATLPTTIAVFGPLYFAIRNRRMRKLSRWRPECPECGHEIRRQSEPRCAECGAAFPTTSRVYRRWAVRRLPWDRKPHNGWISAYLHTLPALACPGRAANRIAMPDRWGRAISWALLHLFGLLPLVAFAALIYYAAEALFTGNTEFWERSKLSLAERQYWNAYLWQRTYINVQTCICWGIAGLAIALPAFAIIASHPRLSPIARRTAAKWTIYALAIASWIALLLNVTYFALDSNSRRFRSRPLDPAVLLHAAALCFAWLWAAGFVRNRYQHRRRSLTMYAALYTLLWCGLILWLMPSGELWQMLN